MPIEECVQLNKNNDDNENVERPLSGLKIYMKIY